MDKPSDFFDRVSTFKKNNSHCDLSLKDDNVVLSKPWGRDDAKLIVPIIDQNFIKDLNNVRFDPCYDAILHLDENIAEFVYSFVNPEDDEDAEYLDRSFQVYWEGKEVKCKFGRPTPRLWNVAKYFKGDEFRNRQTLTQIEPFSDKAKDNVHERNKKYLEDRIPTCFFIELPDVFDTLNFSSLVKSLNCVMRYYDRETPVVTIHRYEKEKEDEFKEPIQYIEDSFPETIQLREFDETLYQLLDVASSSNSRTAFMYYYQVFEYSGHYHIEAKTKHKLELILKNPSIMNCTENTISKMMEILNDINHNDDVKIRRVIEQICDPKMLWKEVLKNIDFYSREHSFDGGFVASPLVSSDTSEDGWIAMWTPKCFDHITKIRNCIVHAREKRQGKVILPSSRNNRILRGYIPLISRIAEQLVIFN